MVYEKIQLTYNEGMKTVVIYELKSKQIRIRNGKCSLCTLKELYVLILSVEMLSRIYSLYIYYVFPIYILCIKDCNYLLLNVAW